MKIIFFGTPDYCLPVLEKIYKYYEIVAVVTQSPKPVGREKILTYSAVDNWAHKKHIPIHFNFEKLPKADLGILVAYGKIIPESTLNSFKFGILNIHPSLLPKFRGASPIQENIIEEPEKIGVTIIKLDSKMDHGPIVTQFKDELLPDDTLNSVRQRLFERSSDSLLELLPAYEKEKITLKKQDESLATYTKLIKKDDGFIDLKKDDPEKIMRKSKAYFPWPGIWTKLSNGKRLKILSCHMEEKNLILDEVQLEGKGPVSWNQFKSAYSKDFTF
ncbi:hypothetical protein A2422_04030 [Candidatus Woesebacteria bacterium RIFOXYC1_FULL_31_51]|uniref:methionyl-tRNA formyltransferase n=1 Tax=Candidatus Woesebacteria bacterium GW2011_GWC2_31_9 TaxID=1618586 RepID=A0A0F9Z0S9_9BACT|nr:MAG: Methionyl-tRNA formyltransferase, methionyl-tRNA formyltransferase [Candidatus Woesebacteria bacterium GW2011_GWF1_31_35]KKP22822.1 MAG: Methionyl-tRNA formyltransferase [Candidatus Woesebacteria bacterium GW2011_GWC1_30_29]KKP26690.1 MAG: Methionyl-tRNA formyltransferase [Candidatus Woesebacteria bacterium GW2011_GWD1_31_12]KKP28070.1 MAG: Methionyl-tRNA formyltransferase [Candidatus Woesebacteria bacterium GW2011_GWB1_31_29]KKP32261.1 MAG: Methionyl-tRNA formyltransferase [Candidatus 